MDTRNGGGRAIAVLAPERVEDAHAVTVDYLLARRPDWTLHVFESAGHAVPLELPADYVRRVGQWLSAGEVAGEVAGEAV